MANQPEKLDEVKQRQDRLARARALGWNAYPAQVKRTHAIAQLRRAGSELAKGDKQITLVGRIRSLRSHGGSTFAHLEDGTGRFQLYFKKDKLGEESYKNFSDLIDIGDFLQASGTLFTTKKGEETLLATSWGLAAKTLRPLPEKWHGLRDVEIRFRKRYLDLLMNEEVREHMRLRSQIIDSIRAIMKKHDFLEVETPTLQPVYGGGFAKPFKTHHNALDADFYLRISDEMYLKRLLVGGFERVYEITKVFRNEGIDRGHNPEFTMFEAQAAYQDYQWGMDLFEEIFEEAAKTALGATKIRHGELAVDLKRPWKRMKMTEAIKKITGMDANNWKTAKEAKEDAAAQMQNHPKQKEMENASTIGEVMAFAFEELVEKKLIEPTIIYDYPVEVSPLAKKCADPKFAERFEGFILGLEVGNNYSELNDPLDLAQRFMAEKKRASAGFAEAHQTDLDYLEAIEHGMPPACGLGIGIDRMVMLLTGASNIKEVILFPTLRPKEKISN